VEPENRLVARSLERNWNECLGELEAVKIRAQESQRQPSFLTEEELKKIQTIGANLDALWKARTTENRDRKRLLRCVIDEAQIRTEKKHYRVLIVWKGGATTEREVIRQKAGKGHATPEETVDLVRKLAEEFEDAQIARILNKQGRRTGLGNTFTKVNVRSLRGSHRIPKCPKPFVRDPKEGPFTADEAARELGVTMSTIHRWLREGVLAGEQMTRGAPWRIVLSDEVRKRLTGGEAPEGWVGLQEASHRLGLTKSHVSDLVKTGKLQAVRTPVGKRVCWRIDLSSATCGVQPHLFEQMTKEDIKEE